jgi:hypothetical protein
MEHAWTVLFRAVCGNIFHCLSVRRLQGGSDRGWCIEVDVQVFSVSLLTTVAIMEGVIQSLVQRCRPDYLSQRSGTLGPMTPSGTICSKTTCFDISQEQARKEAEHVLCEMQILLGVSDVSWWIHHLNLLIRVHFTDPPSNLSALVGTI